MAEGRVERKLAAILAADVAGYSRLMGDGVNSAARLESQAPRGGVMTSDVVYNQVTGKVGVTFIDAGEVELKNIDRPLRVRLSWADAEALDRVLAPLLAPA